MNIVPVAPPLVHGVGNHASLGPLLASTDVVTHDIAGLAAATPNEIRAGINTTAVGAATFKNTATIVASYFAPTATATIATGTIFAVMHRRHVRPVNDLNAPRRPAAEVNEQLATVKCFVMREDQVGGVHIHVLNEPGAMPYFHPTHNEFFMTRAEFDASHPVVHVLAPGPFLVRFQAILATLPPLGAGAQFLGVPMPAPALIPGPAPFAVAPIAPAPLGAALAPMPIPAPVALGAALAPPVQLPIPAAGGGGIVLPPALITQLLQTLVSNQGGHKSAATDNYDGKSRFPLLVRLFPLIANATNASNGQPTDRKSVV